VRPGAGREAGLGDAGTVAPVHPAPAGMRASMRIITERRKAVLAHPYAPRHSNFLSTAPGSASSHRTSRQAAQQLLRVAQLNAISIQQYGGNRYGGSVRHDRNVHEA
jgi:hypothetical protein